jgi:hypothetical protein
MLLPVPMVASSRRKFFIQYQQDSPSETELFEQMNMTLEGLLRVFIPQLSHSQVLQPEQPMPNIHHKIASLAIRQLFHSIIKAENPTSYHDSVFLHLPLSYVNDLLDYLLGLDVQFWKGHLQVCWLHDILVKLYDKGNLSNANIRKCVEIFQKTLIPHWPDSELQVLLTRTLYFLGELWKNPAPFYGNLVCTALCNILEQSFTKGIRDRKVVEQFIEVQALIAVGFFLMSEECDEDCGRKWHNLIKEWEKRFDRYTPSAQELYQYDCLKNWSTYQLAFTCS